MKNNKIKVKNGERALSRINRLKKYNKKPHSKKSHTEHKDLNTDKKYHLQISQHPLQN